MLDAKKIFEQMLKLPEPWKVSGVTLDEANKRVEVSVEYEAKEAPCPQTGEICKIHDRIKRCWRHLDTMDYETWICSRLPRVKNSLGELHLIAVDWSETGLSHTRLFENRCIVTLQKTHCQKSASDLVRTKNVGRARGLKRRNVNDIKAISIDEKSYRKGQQYVSVLTSAKQGEVLDIYPGAMKWRLRLCFKRCLTRNNSALLN
ncbi:MAG: transposase [Bacteroidetes bacterium]|nr:transposase [Bacteroidota bacterium]